MTAPISPLNAHLGYWLRYVSNHVSQGFARRIEERGVTVAEWVVMRELYDADALAPSLLAERIGMTRGAITKLADRLIAKSLLRRRADPGDGRAQTLALTASARRLVPQLAALADANDADFFGHLGKAERAKLQGLLEDIVKRRSLCAVPID
ncbi:MAG TPA: MarR family transcriptional regulator [Burkholderiales bacterium]